MPIYLAKDVTRLPYPLYNSVFLFYSICFISLLGGHSLTCADTFNSVTYRIPNRHCGTKIDVLGF